MGKVVNGLQVIVDTHNMLKKIGEKIFWLRSFWFFTKGQMKSFEGDSLMEAIFSRTRKLSYEMEQCLKHRDQSNWYLGTYLKSPAQIFFCCWKLWKSAERKMLLIGNKLFLFFYVLAGCCPSWLGTPQLPQTEWCLSDVSSLFLY